jgi:hypothetical protein
MSTYTMSRRPEARSTAEIPAVVHLRRASPLRPVDWRWERARLMYEDPPVSRRLSGDGDDFIRSAYRFRMALNRCQDAMEILDLRRKAPDLSDAYYLTAPEAKLTRDGLHANLLTGDTLENIAQRVSLRVQVVKIYERLFFNVLDRLDNKEYIAHRVMGPTLYSLREGDYEILWMLYGYTGGVEVMKMVMQGGIEQAKPQVGQLGDALAFAGDNLQNCALVKGMVAMRTAPTNSYTWSQIVEIHQRFIELKNQVDSAGSGASEGLTVNIQAMFDSLPWAVGGEKPVLVSPRDPEKIVGKLPPPLLAADGFAAELREQELTQLSMGEVPDRLQKDLGTKRFPTRDEVDEERAREAAEEEIKP